MKIQIKGFDVKNNLIIKDLNPLKFEQFIGMLGFKAYFKLTFLEPISEFLVKMEITIENEKPILCFVDGIEEIFKDGTHFFCVNLKSYKNQICENFAKPKLYSEFTIQMLYKEYLKPYNLYFNRELQKSSEYFSRNKPINNFCINFGMTIFNVINLFFNLTLFKDVILTKDDILDILKPSRHILTFKKGHLDYTYLKLIDDRSKIISRVFMSSTKDENTFLASKQESSFSTECLIKRERYIKTPPQLEAFPNNGADLIQKKLNSKRKRYELSSPNYIKAYPLDIVNITTPKSSFNKTCYVKNVKFSLNEKGEETKLTLFEI